MANRLLLTILVLSFISTRVRSSATCVPPLHVKQHGLNLICCSLSSPLLDSCEFRTLCRDDACRCYLTLNQHFRCSRTDELKHSWQDHSTSSSVVSCAQPNLPNRQNPYNIRIDDWEQNYTMSFLQSLQDVNVNRLIVNKYSASISHLDFAKYLPSLLFFEMNLSSRQFVDIYDSIRSLSRLESLRVINADFEFWKDAASWVRTISYMHLENSTLSVIPKWLAVSRLRRIFLKNTHISSVSIISQLRNIRSAHMSRNEINDLHRHIFMMDNVYDLDFSHNKIRSIGTHTFSQCAQLAVLDLSNNPLQHLPYKPFSKNNKLKWLKLSGTRIKTLTPDHFVGLKSLKTLILANCPIQSISPYAFLPLKSLKSLDLHRCNLTTIPTAVTQNCGLTHLNIGYNLIYRKSSLPPQVLALLSSLSQFKIDGNPLSEFAPSLLLLSANNVKLYRQLIHASTALPMWTKEPCTPYYWMLHLRNRSSSLRRLVADWTEQRMKQENMEYCVEQYEWMMDQMEIYRELEQNSGCSVKRSLRSPPPAPSSSCPTSQSTTSPLPPTCSNPHAYTSLIIASLTANCILAITVVIVCMCACSANMCPSKQYV